MYDTWDENSDGVLSYEESDKVTKIDITSDSVSSLKGVEAFRNLDTLICRGVSCGQDGGSGSLSEIDLKYLNWRYNPNISYMDLSNNRLSSALYISMMKWLDKLKYLNLSGNSLEIFSTSYWLGPNLTELDLSNNYFLGIFQSQCENLESLNLRGCSKLEHLEVSSSSVKSLDLSDFTEQAKKLALEEERKKQEERIKEKQEALARKKQESSEASESAHEKKGKLKKSKSKKAEKREETRKKKGKKKKEE